MEFLDWLCILPQIPRFLILLINSTIFLPFAGTGVWNIGIKVSVKLENKDTHCNCSYLLPEPEEEDWYPFSPSSYLRIQCIYTKATRNTQSQPLRRVLMLPEDRDPLFLVTQAKAPLIKDQSQEGLGRWPFWPWVSRQHHFKHYLVFALQFQVSRDANFHFYHLPN